MRWFEISDFIFDKTATKIDEKIQVEFEEANLNKVQVYCCCGYDTKLHMMVRH